MSGPVRRLPASRTGGGRPKGERMRTTAVSARAGAPRRALDEASSAALLVAVGAPRVSAANEAAEALFGAAPGALAGVTVAELVPRLGELALRSPEPLTVRVEARRRDGVPFAAEARLR